MDNMNGDLLDDGLRAVMGEERRQDVSGDRKSNPSVSYADSSLYTREPLGAAKAGKAKREEGFKDAKWDKVPAYAPNWYDRLKGCAKCAMVWGSLVALFGYWHISGQMDGSAAIPCMVACGCFGGFKIGNVCRK